MNKSFIVPKFKVHKVYEQYGTAGNKKENTEVNKEMSEVRYIISDASRKLKIEPHALRYWEEELHLDIPRNEMGHRYYTEENVEQLKRIRKLKEKGFSLKAIKMVLPQLDQLDQMDEVNLYRIREEYNLKAEGEGNITVVKNKDNKIEIEDGGVKMQQFRAIMKDLIVDAIRENNRELSNAVGENVSDNVLKEMDYLMRDKDEKDEERYRQLDEVIRGVQKARQEVAATELVERNAKKDKKKLFGRKK